MRSAIAIPVLILGAALLAGCGEPPARPRVRISTDRGDIICELFPDQAPETVANFIGLADGTKAFTHPRSGEQVTRPFYDGLVFHRVIADFMIQGGCPNGRGNGGPGYTFADEINAVSLGLDRERVVVDLTAGRLNPQCAYFEQQWFQQAAMTLMRQDGWNPTMDAAESQRRFDRARRKLLEEMSVAQRFRAYGKPLEDLAKLSLKQYYEQMGYTYREDLPASTRPVKGALCMANSGPNTNGSQFFLNLRDTPHLTGKHTVFGRVVAGAEVLAAIGAVPVDPRSSRPLEPVVIRSIRSLPPRE